MPLVPLIRGALCAAVLGVLGSTAALAQSPDYHLRVESAAVPFGASADLRITLDSSGGDVQGWSFGVCHDTSRVTLEGVTSGVATLTAKNGAPADFDQVNEVAGGWTSGVVICFTACGTLPPAVGHELYVATYRETAGTVGTTDLCFCDTLGAPVVSTVVVVGSVSNAPTTHCGTFEAIDLPPFRFRAPTATGTYSPDDGIGSATIDLFIAENQPTGAGQASEAFAMGIGHDPTLLTPRSVVPTGAAATLNGGVGPDFFGPNLLADGVTLGSVYSFVAVETLSFANESAVVRIVYDTVPATLTGNDIGVTTTLMWSDALGSPPIENIVVVAGQSLGVEMIDGILDLAPATSTPFVRGDCNEDGALNVADGVWLLNYLFLNGPSRDCLAACDTDDDQSVGFNDAILLIQYWMIGGPAPSAPYPLCGVDDTSAGCPTYNCP